MQRPPSAIIHGHMYTCVIGNCLRHVGLAMTCGRCEWTWCNNRNVNIAIYRSARCTNHSPAWWATVHHRERKCADTTGIVPVPWAGHFLCQNINLFFLQIKYTEATYQTTLGNCYGLKLHQNADCCLRKKFYSHLLQFWTQFRSLLDTQSVV